VLLVVLQVAGTAGAADGQPSRRPLDGLALVLLVLGPAALWTHRRAPRVVCAVVVATAAAYLALGYPYGPVFASVAVALVATVLRGHRLTAWVAAGALLVADAATHVRSGAGGAWWAPELVVSGWAVVVLSVAEVVRVRAERAASFRQAAQERRRRQAGEERLQIARELHDVVAHHLSLINVQAGVALHLAERRPENVEPALRAIKDASGEALGELRSLIDVLRDDRARAPRAPAPTLATVDDIVERSAHAGLQVTKTIEGQVRPLPAAVELAACRVVQEAITNVVRHAHARRAVVALGYGAGLLTVRVDDDGRATVGEAQLEQGNGLRGMHERAAALGGTLAVGASPIGGLRVELTLPTGDGK
jgi:signal transduction histidine kinase